MKLRKQILISMTVTFLILLTSAPMPADDTSDNMAQQVADLERLVRLLERRVESLEAANRALAAGQALYTNAPQPRQEVNGVPGPQTPGPSHHDPSIVSVSPRATSEPQATADSFLRGITLHGFFSTRFEKLISVPERQDGRIVYRSHSGEWDTPFFHLMFQGKIGDRYRAFININGDGGSQLDLRNFWGEYQVNQGLSLRLGKTYRFFGLYNEILDAVPTYVGVEPPELFDADHLILSRTTTLMAHGSRRLGGGILEYSVSSDNGEGARIEETFPLGFDLNYSFGFDRYRLGISGYTSSGKTTPDRPLGSGSPRSGVLPWMASDEFHVLGGYAETTLGRWTLQGAYWRASHNARRDPASVVRLVNEADLTSFQLARFLHDPGLAATETNVRRIADYNVETWYLRASYTLDTKVGEFVPYAFWDWYSNPETIGQKTFGGDNEAGLADDGRFHKPTLGVVYRPIRDLAIKVDGSAHLFRLMGRDVSFPELRFDVSFLLGSQ